ncbi:hypothetical protein [Stenotrophomonas nitritireducens]|uniref:hypothetical protein n=1 Tax=Stenotrophomonas nitritireducens TaxID=83617 RepID=UPI003D962DA4
MVAASGSSRTSASSTLPLRTSWVLASVMSVKTLTRPWPASASGVATTDSHSGLPSLR